jgi:NitT/TauT family transport system ATP-binding protein
MDLTEKYKMIGNYVSIPKISVRNFTVVYEGNHGMPAVKDFSFNVTAGGFTCLLGTSGCGKSTIINAIAGFVPPTKGQILMDGNLIIGPGPDRVVVFQNHVLFPWKTVLGNVEFGPRMRGKSKKDYENIAKEYIELVGLRGYEQKYPGELSGGMAQRVGLARALASEETGVILMDEPFGSLDAQTRLMMHELLLKIWDDLHKTIVFVTHDVDEAILLAEEIIIMTASPGRVKRVLDVPMPRPRSYRNMATPEYTKIKAEVLTLIREETLKVMNIPSLIKE